MAYTLPSVHIYQLLENSGGAARVTPDLEAVVIGALINVVDVETNPLKAKSLEFSAWPGASVDPPIDPPVETFFTLTSAKYVDFGFDGSGIVITGTSSDNIGVNFGIGIMKVAHNSGQESSEYYWNTNGIDNSGHSTPPTYTRNADTGVWTFITTKLDTPLGDSLSLLDFVSDPMNYDGTSENSYTFEIEASATTASGTITRALPLSRKLAPISFIASPELKVLLTDTVSLTVDEPTVFHYYDHVINEASNK